MISKTAQPAVSPDPAPWPSFGAAWWIVSCAIAAAFLCTMDRLVLNLLVDPIRSDLVLSETQFSLLQGISFTAVNSIAALPLGLLADRVSRRNILIFGIGVWSGATALGGLSSSFGEFVAARIFVGMGEAALWPVAVSLIADVLPPHQRGRAIGMVLLGQILGGGASLILTGLVMRLAPTGVFDFVPYLGRLAPWRLVMVLWGGLGLVAILMLLSGREPVRRDRAIDGRDPTGFSTFLKHVRRERALIVPIYIGACFMGIGTYALAAWAPSFFIRRFHVSPGEIGPILGLLNIVAGIVGTTVAGVFCDRAEARGQQRRKLTLIVCALLACLPVTALVLAPTLGVAIDIQAVSLLFFPIAGTVNTIILQDQVPSAMRGKAMALLGLASSLVGGTLGPTLVAMTTQYIYRSDQAVGYSLATVLIPALLIAAFCYSLTRRQLAKRPAASLVTAMAAA